MGQWVGAAQQFKVDNVFFVGFFLLHFFYYFFKVQITFHLPFDHLAHD
jgi:hypothetical protein